MTLLEIYRTANDESGTTSRDLSLCRMQLLQPKWVNMLRLKQGAWLAPFGRWSSQWPNSQLFDAPRFDRPTATTDSRLEIILDLHRYPVPRLQRQPLLRLTLRLG
jgi:hypothetical protein